MSRHLGAVALPAVIEIHDVAAAARELLYGDRATDVISGLPERDDRFYVELPSGAKVTFGRHTTASEIVAYLRAEGALG